MQIVRLYYSFILQGVRGARYSDSKVVYKLVNNYFKKEFPGYIDCLNFSLLKGFNGSRFRKIIMKGFVMLEKANVYNIVLFFYSIFSKLRYIST